MIADAAPVTDILSQIVAPNDGSFGPELARYILGPDFTPAQHAMYATLSSKVQEGNLSAAERETLDTLIFANTMLGILQSKARVSIRRHQPAVNIEDLMLR